MQIPTAVQRQLVTENRQEFQSLLLIFRQFLKRSEDLSVQVI